MKPWLEALRQRIGLLVLLIAALAAGYGLNAWLTPSAGPAPSGGTEAKAELWVCSMNNNPHPYYSSDKPGKCKYCDMDLIPAETGDQGLGPRQLAMSERAKALARIETTRVERRTVEAEVRMSGTLEYDETRLSYITAWVPGRIDRLFVDYTGCSSITPACPSTPASTWSNYTAPTCSPHRRNCSKPFRPRRTFGRAAWLWCASAPRQP